MVPKTTSPLAKSIRTLEAQLAVAVNVVLAIGSAIDPHKLPPTVAGILSVVTTVALILQRGLLKTKALGYVSNVVNSPDPLGEIVKEVEEASAGQTPAPTAS